MIRSPSAGGAADRRALLSVRLLVLSAGAQVGAGAGAEGAFPESRLISPVQGAQLNGWANQTAGRRWELCYTSFTMNKTAAEFHKRCDKYKPTVTVAHNSLNHTFGGFVRLPFIGAMKIVQGWPKLWPKFKALIGIFSQSVGAVGRVGPTPATLTIFFPTPYTPCWL